MMKLSDNDFEIFGLQPGFKLDEAALTQAYLRLQGQTHPDRFANAGQAERRLAVQWATRINEGYKRLTDPVERAIYWCQLQGTDPKTHQSGLPVELLMQQMEWREALAELATLDEADTLLATVNKERRNALGQVELQIDELNDVNAACHTLQGLLFMNKFLLELNKKLEQLEDAA